MAHLKLSYEYESCMKGAPGIEKSQKKKHKVLKQKVLLSKF